VPKLRTVRGACDSHLHVFGPYDRFPLNGDRSYTPPEATIDSYRAVMNTLGLQRAVIVHGSAHGMDLRATIHGVETLGANGRGVAVLPPTVTDEELDRLHAVGFRGTRVVTKVRGGVNPSAALDLARRVGRLGWHLQLLIDGPSELEDMAPRLRELPIPYVIDSMGGFSPEHGLDHPGIKALLKLLETGRCWTKLIGAERRSHAGPPYADMAPLARAIVEARPDRVVWGTDWPHVMAWSYAVPDDADLLDWLLQIDVSEAARKAILVDNPIALYGFDPA
jgi:predicted TIM-barrel fold metal-dependent hydrolase